MKQTALRLTIRCDAGTDILEWPDGGAAGEWRETSALPRTRVRLDALARAGAWRLTVDSPAAWRSDVEAELSFELAVRFDDLFWPAVHGRWIGEAAAGGGWRSFHGAGRPTREAPYFDRLALPLLVAGAEGPGESLLVGTDPAFSTTLVADRAHGGGATRVTAGWRWLADAGAHERFERLIVCRPVENDLEAALAAWFEDALPDVPAGPAWLKEIAFQGFDYLSRNGQGWYDDVDALTELIPADERQTAIVCLHGWYDRIGEYSLADASGALKSSWTAFDQIGSPELAAIEIDGEVTPDELPADRHGFRNLARSTPVEMSWDDVRGRLRYARERGFRTGFYLLTGLQRAGDPAPHVADGTGLEGPDFPLWIGPDLIGPTYVENPLHPDVRARYLAYVAAVLDEVGDDVNAFCIDQGCYVGYGTLAPEACPGYADRGQIELFKEIAALCHATRPDLALMVADVLGLPGLERLAFPYSLFADGLWQDAWSWPSSWDLTAFQTRRNVAWSCNWASLSNLAWSEYAVHAHGAPAAWSVGCFGDDVGLAELEPALLERVRRMWEVARDRGPRPPLPIVSSRTPAGTPMAAPVYPS